jgi:hypothetical protein
MQTKALTNVEVKDAAKGHVTAVFATLGVVDKDGDVTVNGAFKEGAKVAISPFGHKIWDGAPAVGKGSIHERGNEVVCDMQFFMNTTHGRDAFETIKGLTEDDGPGTEWSYGFDVLDSEVPTQKQADNHKRTLKAMRVHEVSPVMVGAGVGTRVTSVKSNKTFAEQLTDVLASVKAVRERATEVMAMRAEKGKGLGDETKALFDKLLCELDSLADIYVDTDEKQAELQAEADKSANDELRAAYLRFVRDNA